jgi:hypothetical protein
MSAFPHRGQRVEFFSTIFFPLLDNSMIGYSWILDIVFVKHPGNVAKRNQDVN